MVSMASHNNSVSKKHDSDWINMLVEKLSINSKSLIDMHSSLSFLFNDPRIPFQDVMKHFELEHEGVSLIFNVINATHYIIFSKSNKDCLLHFVIKDEDDKEIVTCHSVSRESMFSELEADLVDREIQRISTGLFHLGKRFLK